jgi:hypothetical protein
MGGILYGSNDKPAININFIYPNIVNNTNSKFIDEINKTMSVNAETEMKVIEDEYMPFIEELIKEFVDDVESTVMLPFVFEKDFDVTRDSNDILSMISLYYLETGGAHPNSLLEAYNYDMANEKVLNLSDILNGTQDEIDAFVVEKFSEYFKTSVPELYEERVELLKEEAPNVSLYINGDKLVLSFQVYQVASYAEQYPTVEIPYTGNEQAFKLDLSMTDSAN